MDSGLAGKSPRPRMTLHTIRNSKTLNYETHMQKILITGAAGDVGGRLTALLKDSYRLRLSDIKTPAGLAADADFVAADLADQAAVERAVAGVDGIVHLGGFSVEGPWDTILNSNIIGCFHLFDAGPV